MQEKQDLIIQHNFSYRLQKSIQDKIGKLFDASPDLSKNKIKNSGKDDANKDNKSQIKSQKDIVCDQVPSHLRWRIKENKNFLKTFYFNSKKFPKTKDGKVICMNLVLRGICDKTCTRAQNLSLEDEQTFDTFVQRCHEGGASKPDF